MSVYHLFEIIVHLDSKAEVPRLWATIHKWVAIVFLVGRAIFLY